MEQDSILYENEGTKTVITFDRPDKGAPNFRGKQEKEEHQKWIKGTR